MYIQRLCLIAALSFSTGFFPATWGVAAERPPVLSLTERVQSVRNSNDLLSLAARQGMSYRFVIVGQRPQFDLSSLESLDWGAISSIVDSTTGYQLSVEGSVVSLYPKSESLPAVFNQKLASLSFKDTPILEALQRIGAEFKIELSPHLKPAVANAVKVNIDLQEATLSGALNKIADQYANGSWALNIPGEGEPKIMGFILSMPLNLPLKRQN